MANLVVCAAYDDGGLSKGLSGSARGLDALGLAERKRRAAAGDPYVAPVAP
jgi:hypothetical protein